VIWILMHPQATAEHLGFVPQFFDDTDPRPAAAQLEENYAHGGGWRPFGQGQWRIRASDGALVYPGSPEDGEPDEVYPLIALAPLPLTHECLQFYTSSFLAVVQEDGAIEVTRVD
jgi:hypothetical protein